MAFFSDIGARDEARGPIWGPFAIVRDNVERLVAINLGWSLQLLPGVFALAFSQIPLWIRIAMGLYSATAAIPCTGALFALASDASRGEHLSLELAVERLRQFAAPSVRLLTPLYGVFGALIWAAILLGPSTPAITTLVTFFVLLWFLCSTYLGPMMVIDPQSSVFGIAKRSARMVWKYPAETLSTALVNAGALLVGFISIGGLILIVPVLIALLQTQRCLDLIDLDRLSAAGE